MSLKTCSASVSRQANTMDPIVCGNKFIKANSLIGMFNKDYY